MALFNERERAFEAKFALDQDRRHLALARAYRLFGLWAADRLRLAQEDRETYASFLMRLGLEHADDRFLLDKIRADCEMAGLDIADADLQAALRDARMKAHDQLRIEDLTTPESHPTS